jgi:hypothetical protein
MSKVAATVSASSGIEHAHIDAAPNADATNRTDLATLLKLPRHQSLFRHGVQGFDHLAKEGLAALPSNAAV